MNTVDRLIRRIDDAATEPFEGEMTGENIFIKTAKGRWSDKVLINEYICFRMARILDMPIPDAGVCLITDKTDIHAIEEYLDCCENINGVAFYSKRIDRAVPTINSHNVINNIINKSDINRIILFDHLIYNEDRHKGNLLYSFGKGINGLRMNIIDHSHVFNLKHSWSVYGLQELICKQDYMDTKILENNYEELYKFFYHLGLFNKESLVAFGSMIEERINKNVLISIINELPKEWIINYDDVEMLSKYILYRVEHIKDIVNIILDYFKISGGE